MRRPVLLAVLVSVMVALSAATAFAAITRPDFRAPKFYKAGPGPDGISTGDFNEDGTRDLVTSNRYGGTTADNGDVSCLKGNGDGTFDKVSEQELTTSANSISTGNLNRDTHLDVVLTDPDSSPPSVVVLLGNGNCTFTKKDTEDSGGVSPGYDPFDTALGDFDEDGDTDVAVTNQESNSVRIFDNNRRGNLSNDQTIPLGDGSGPNGIAAGALDADSDPDLAVALSGTGRVAVLKNDGSGTFTLSPRSRTIVNAEAPSPSPLVLADFNEDGELDVATGNIDGNDADDDVVAAALGNGDGTFQAPVFKSSGGDCPLSLETGDYGRDGTLDIAAANQFCSTSGVNRGNFSVLSGNGDGTFAGPDRFGAGDGPLGITDGRYNADNLPDIATATFGAGGPENETDTVAVSLNRTTN